LAVTSRPRASGNKESRRGYGVDPVGEQVIDPTKNVLDLVAAAIARQDDLRAAADKLTEVRVEALKQIQDFKHISLAQYETARHDAESRIQNWMRDSEMKRVAEGNVQRQFYETRIADMLRTSVESTSTLVSNQLVQIQSTFNDRVSQLERFRYETGGKSSVSDIEATRLRAEVSDSLTKMASAIMELRTSNTVITGRSEGHREVTSFMQGWGGLIAAGVLALLAFVAWQNSSNHPTAGTVIPQGYMLVPTPSKP